MATARVRSPRFRALEYFCLLYDVAVDQEDYNGPWCSITGEALRDPVLDDLVKIDDALCSDTSVAPWNREHFSVDLSLHVPKGLSGIRIALHEPHGDTEKRLLKSVVLEPLQQDPKIEGCGEDPVVDRLWTKLLVAKVERALLQKRSSTAAAAALDQVGLALVREAPVPERRDTTALADQMRILRWLFLNEASACYHGHHSIALADDCLNHIKDEVGEGVSPHELVALYNKAQGSLHDRDHIDALGRFRQVSEYLIGESDSDQYFCQLSLNPYAWPNCRRLFDTYLRVPSVVQAADTLLNLQRSTDSERELDKLKGLQLTEYQQARVDVMLARIANDLGGARLEKPVPEWRESACAHKRGIALQSLGVEAERHGLQVTELVMGISAEPTTTGGESCPA